MPNFPHGNVVGLDALGDWERKKERIGDVEGEGMLGREEEGVGGSDSEKLVEPDDADETETERGLLRIAIGMETGADFSFEDM